MNLFMLFVIIFYFFVMGTISLLTRKPDDGFNLKGFFSIITELSWKDFKKHRPKENDWYLCTVKYFINTKNTSQVFTKILYWNGEGFIDDSRKSVFNQYQVMIEKEWNEDIQTNAIMPNTECLERIDSDSDCDMTKHIVAWKKAPAPYRAKN